MKDKRIFKFLIFAVLLIPLYVAIYHMSLIASDKLIPDNVTRVVVTGANNTEYEYTDRNDIRLYIQIIENAETVEEPLRDLESEESFTVSFFKGQNQIGYQLYLSKNLEDCLMRDSDRKWRVLRRADAEKLLATPIADSLYKFNNVPTVQVIYDDGSEITVAYPSGGEWYLKKPNNLFVKSNVQNIFKSINDIRAARGKLLEFKFNAEPDLLNIIIYSDNEIIFSGSYENFHSFIYDTNSDLRYVLTAEWHKNDFLDYHGEAEYNFNVEYSVPPVFDISIPETDSVMPGEIVIVTALNMRDFDSPTITAENMEYTADFIKINDNHLALLPISLSSTGGVFDIELSGSSVAEDRNFRIHVSELTYNSVNVGAQDSMFNAHKLAAPQESRAASYNNIFASNNADKIYWENDPKFMMPHQGNILLDYGWSVTVNTGARSQKQGVNISAAAGSPIAAAHSGRVVFAGTVPDDGNLLVIDHGGGVKSWYGHLGTINVSVGNEVAKGQEIAVSGTSGLYTTTGPNLYFAVSVHNVFVNPIAVIENGILPN